MNANFLSNPPRLPKVQTGFTLVELLVAMVLGIFLVGGVVSIYSSTQQNFKANENLARIQESARFAFEQLGREIRDQGNNPCGVKAVASVVRTAGALPWWANWADGTLVGYEGTATFAAAAFGTAVNQRVSGTDGLMVLRTRMEDSNLRVIESHTVTAALNAFNLKSVNTTTDPDQVFLACDNNSGALFQVTAATNSAPPNIQYSAIGQNCSSKLGLPQPADCTGTTDKVFSPGGFIAEYDPAFWYIGVGANNSRSLYRTSLVRRTVSGSRRTTTEPREMITNVHDLQIEYLTRNNALATPALATTWVRADDAVFTVAPLPPATAGWGSTNNNEVVAVRLILTFKSPDAVGTDGLPLQRQTISVISLRNRELKAS
jgi:type IV pilus assembly protein PilW